MALCLLLVTGLCTFPTSPARADGGGVQTLEAQPSTLNAKWSPEAIDAAFADIVQREQEYDQQEEEFQQAAQDVIAEAAQITEQSTALKEQADALSAKIAALNQQTDSLNEQSQALEAKIEAHNNEPHTFELPQQQAEADTYAAEADELNGEKSQLEAEQNSDASQQTQLGNQQTDLTNAEDQLNTQIETHNEKVTELDGEEQDLEAEGQQLLEQMAEAMNSLEQNPPDAGASMDAGGDAAAPTQQADGSDQSANEDTGQDGGDASSRQPQTSALQQYAQKTGSNVDMQPGIAYLTPESVSSLPASQSAALTSPEGSYDGLVPEPNGNDAALEVQAPTPVSPSQAAFVATVRKGGKARGKVAGRWVVIDQIIEVPEPSSPRPPAPSTSTTTKSKAACLTNRPAGAEASGDGWILNTTEEVPLRNQTNPAQGPGQRSSEGQACLTNPLVNGTKASGDITGFQDARAAAPNSNLARCHVIGNVLGGRGNDQPHWSNLFPCWQVGLNIGAGNMYDYELKVRGAVGGLPIGAGDAVFYEVTPVYRNNKSTIPYEVTMNAEVESSDGATWPVFTSVTLQNVSSATGQNLGN